MRLYRTDLAVEAAAEFKQRLPHGGDEHAGAADLGEGASAVAVAMGAHVHQLDLVAGALHDRGADVPGLREREL